MVSVYQGASARFCKGKNRPPLVFLFLTRGSNHDHRSRSVRERVFERCSHNIHGADCERTHHGRTGDYHLVRLILLAVSLESF